MLSNNKGIGKHTPYAVTFSNRNAEKILRNLYDTCGSSINRKYLKAKEVVEYYVDKDNGLFKYGNRYTTEDEI